MRNNLPQEADYRRFRIDAILFLKAFLCSYAESFSPPYSAKRAFSVAAYEEFTLVYIYAQKATRLDICSSDGKQTTKEAV